MKVLINTPQITKLGGVANHYLGLQPYWSEDVHYNTIGSRSIFPGFLLLPSDLTKFFLKCIIMNPDIVVLNPSLGRKAIIRDSLFLQISTFLKIKSIVFFHGWEEKLANEINKNPNWFKKKYKNANAILILASDFKNQILKWGLTCPIYLTTTKVDDKLLKEFKVKEKKSTNNILFLARIIREKGIYIALDAFKEIKKKCPDAKLIVVGDGESLKDAIKKVELESIQNVEFKGKLEGDKLKCAFENADLYILPTYGEGMPTSILEAMAFGLPVFTRPVGGLNDFFENNKMGYLIESLNPIDFAEKISDMLEHPTKMKEIGEFNHFYAKKNFMASEIALKMERFFKMVLQKDFKEK